MPKPRVVKSAPADMDKKCVMSRVSQKVSEQEGVEPCDGPTSARQRRLSGETAPTANSTAFDAPECELGELLRRLEAARGEMAIVSQRMEGLRMRVPNALECDGGDRTWRPPSDRMANPFNANKMVSLKPPSASQSQMHEEMLRMEEVVERFRQDERKRIAMKFGDQPPHTSTNPGITGAADYNPPPWERTIGGSMEQRGRNFHPRADEPEEWRSRSHAMTGLNTSQMAARQCTARELPHFSGNPEDWPVFFASLESSTDLCGYTDDENLLRLQKSLKGKALEAVKYRLYHPANLPGVIDTLRTLFGRPELVVHTLIHKIKRMPAPKADRTETLVEFGVAVQNLCATITAAGLEHYMFDVALLHELTEKLPTSIKLDWAYSRLHIKRVTLATFNE